MLFIIIQERRGRVKVTNIKLKERGKYLLLDVRCPDCNHFNRVRIKHQGQKRGADAEVKCAGCGATITYGWEE